jgi:hypothetical protein
MQYWFSIKHSLRLCAFAVQNMLFDILAVQYLFKPQPAPAALP